MLAAPAPIGGVGLADHAGARVDRLFDPRARLPRLVAPARAGATLAALVLGAALAYSSPRLSSGESTHVHAISIDLLVHRVQARLTGFALTALVVSVAFAGIRKLTAAPRRIRRASAAR